MSFSCPMHWGNYGGGGRSGVKPLSPKTGKNSVKFLIEIQKINMFEIFTWKTPMKNSWLRLWPYASIGFRAEQTKNPNLIINRLPFIFSCIDSKKTIELPPITRSDSPRLNVGYRCTDFDILFIYIHETIYLLKITFYILIIIILINYTRLEITLYIFHFVTLLGNCSFLTLISILNF